MSLDSRRIGGIAACAFAAGWLAHEYLTRVRASWFSSKAPAGAVSESTIRLMTRLAIEHGAVNLSQGFPNEPPPRQMALMAAGAVLAGESVATASAMAKVLESVVPHVKGKDALNQYSFPYGAPVLREAISDYYARWMPALAADAQANITVVMGATEGFAATMRALTSPGDTVVFFQPFHELYPSQASIFGLQSRAVTLCEVDGRWAFDERELSAALEGATLLLFNSPHNPTGHVFSALELTAIARQCVAHDVVAVTDEIYEHIYASPKESHASLATVAVMRDRVVVVNSISKTAKATGWRIGWVVASAERTEKIRAVHDQLVCCCPTPLQVGVAQLLAERANDETYFATIRDEYLVKRDLLVAALREVGFEVGALPQGAYYIFARYANVQKLCGLSPTEAAMFLTTQVKVACVPGDNFYLGQDAKRHPELGGRYLRFAYVRSVDLLQQAAANLHTHLKVAAWPI